MCGAHYKTWPTIWGYHDEVQGCVLSGSHAIGPSIVLCDITDKSLNPLRLPFLSSILRAANVASRSYELALLDPCL